MAEAFSYWNTNATCVWGPHENLCLNNILRNGTAEQKLRYLPGLCSGESIGAMGLTEPGAGSDALGGMSTVARRDGDHYVLNGRKMFISNGPIADVLLIYAKTAPERGPKGISAFIVEKGFAGFHAEQKLRKMGWRGAPTGELVFEDCRGPAETLLGTTVTKIKVSDHYSCRLKGGRSLESGKHRRRAYRPARSRMSEHAFGNAVDVSRITFANGLISGCS